jgi:hypothetical protein
MLGRIAVELQQHVEVVDDLGDRLGILRAEVDLEGFNRDLRLVDVLGVVDVLECGQRRWIMRKVRSHGWRALYHDPSQQQFGHRVNSVVSQSLSKRPTWHEGSTASSRCRSQKRESSDSSTRCEPSVTWIMCSMQYHAPQLHFWRGKW